MAILFSLHRKSIQLYFTIKRYKMTLELVTNISKNAFLFGAIDLNDSALFYHFNINLSEGMEDGEYTYYLKDGDKVLATGLLQIGDYKRDENVNTEYNDNNNGYIVYDGK